MEKNELVVGDGLTVDSSEVLSDTAGDAAVDSVVVAAAVDGDDAATAAALVGAVIDPVESNLEHGENEKETIQETFKTEEISSGGELSDLDSDDDSEDDSDDHEDGDEVEMDPEALEIVQALEASVDFDPHDMADETRVTISKDRAEHIRLDIWKEGAARFHQRLLLNYNMPYKPSEVLSALGFPVPKQILDKHGEDLLAMYVHAAIRFSMKTRKRLDYPHNLQEFCDVLDKAQNVIVLTGAGISTSLGIPDFRSKTGLYNRLEGLGLTDPQEVFSMSLFKEDPQIFFSVAKDILPSHDKYSPTHQFIKLLQDKGKLLRNYTQNIDNLEHYAGIEEEKLCQCHGSFATATCVTCKSRLPGESIYKQLRAGEVAYCQECKEREKLANKKRKRNNDDSEDENDYMRDQSQGVLKPDITFFGEALPDRFDKLLFGYGDQIGDAKKCDLLICIGTSLQVAPVADIVRVLPPSVPQVYISRTLSRHNKFDVTFLGNCDDVVELIAEKMDWKLDHEMNRRQHSTNDTSMEDLTYPDGNIAFDESEAIYRFVNPSENSVEDESDGDESDQQDDQAGNL